MFHQVRLLTAKRGKFTVEEILKHEDKTANYKQKYTNEEDAKIMQAVFDVNKNVLEDNNIIHCFMELLLLTSVKLMVRLNQIQ